MDTALFDYHLPPEFIAQEPVEPRDAARLLVAGCQGGTTAHRHLRDLPDLLQPGDLLVLNETRVIPARLFGAKSTGGEVEVLLVHPEPTPTNALRPASELEGERWRCFIRGKVRIGSRLLLGGVKATVRACEDDGDRVLEFAPGVEVLALAERIGHVPLPPYIRRPDRPDDRARYQTVFAEKPGSVAAPTASLHFTLELLEAIRRRGVELARIDLAIGPGTFKPVKCDRVEDHRIHAERCTCPPETVAAIRRCRDRGGRVVAAGTTVVRTLETAADQPGGLAPWSGWTELFLHPPRRLAVVDGLLTNFHLPRSSLLMLVACLTGIDRLLELYRAAIAERYRFYSYGDAMLLLPDAPA
jgi:S-adenosylmethionine:tRNA ribosyltransferase-isomerase